MRPCYYEVWISGRVEYVNRLAGLAWLAYEGARLASPDSARLLRVWRMRDPVLDGVDEWSDAAGGWVRVGRPRIEDRNTCPNRRECQQRRRPANALNVEIGSPADRCMMRPPVWPEGHGNLSWVLSGGSELDYGLCTADCPMEALQQ